MTIGEIVTTGARTGFIYGIAFTAFSYVLLKNDLIDSLDVGLATFAGMTTLCTTNLLAGSTSIYNHVFYKRKPVLTYQVSDSDDSTQDRAMPLLLESKNKYINDGTEADS